MATTEHLALTALQAITQAAIDKKEGYKRQRIEEYVEKHFLPLVEKTESEIETGMMAAANECKFHYKHKTEVSITCLSKKRKCHNGTEGCLCEHQSRALMKKVFAHFKQRYSHFGDRVELHWDHSAKNPTGYEAWISLEFDWSKPKQQSQCECEDDCDCDYEEEY